MAEPKKRDSARISVNKLGEYLVANPIRRRAIIRDQKKPRTIYVARYGKAETEIQHFFTGSGAGIEQLVSVARDLITAEYSTEWKRESAELCSSALHSFIRVAGSVPIEGLICSQSGDNATKMKISEVDVSVRPEILLSYKTSPNNIVGCIKLYFSKATPLAKGTGEFIAAVSYRYIAEMLSNEAAADYKKCFVVDIFGGTVFIAPKNFKNHMKYAEAACSEIAAQWPLL